MIEHRLETGRVVFQVDPQKIDAAGQRFGHRRIGKRDSGAETQVAGRELLAKLSNVADHKVFPKVKESVSPNASEFGLIAKTRI